MSVAIAIATQWSTFDEGDLMKGANGQGVMEGIEIVE